MPIGTLINVIPAPVFIVIHVIASLVGVYFARRSFATGMTDFGRGFVLYAVAELCYVTYHLGWTVFLFNHAVGELLALLAFVLIFAGVSKRVAAGLYVGRLFAPEDAALSAVPQRQKEEGVPAIHVSPVEGKLLTVLLRAAGARSALEIGTLCGYSGIWIARALGENGRLLTIELDQRHAAIAKQSFGEAAVAHQVELRVGSAREILPQLTGRFDAVFIDADKESYPFYYRQSMRLLRVGGLLFGDNALLGFRVANQSDRAPAVVAMREFNQLAASDPRLSSVILPMRDGLLVGVKLAD